MGEDSIDLTSTLISVSEDKTLVTREDPEDPSFLSLSSNASEESLHPLNPTQNVAVGVYLIIAGVLTVIGNASVIGAFFRFRALLSSPYRLLILHLCISDIGMALLAGFLISGTSSVAGRWLFGYKGCQYYAFTGFFFGIANVTFICLMSVMRCLLGMKRPPLSTTKQNIKNCIYFVWLWSLFWSACPLLGWSSYDFEPSTLTCSINWKQNDQYYVSYILCLVSFVFLMPVFAVATSIMVAFKELKKMKSLDSSASGSTVDAIGQLNGIKMCLGLVITCIMCWSAYAILCLWVIFLPPHTVPVFLSVTPPLFAKLSIAINPLIILTFDDNLRQGAFSCLLCKESPPELLSSPETTRMTSSSNDN